MQSGFTGDSRISIHTPTKGVTNTDLNSDTRSGISIHTPTKGVTNVLTYHVAVCLFQSTLPQRE